jgi:peptidoglycan hydrolase-like protein with peptidoglycan-binding domain
MAVRQGGFMANEPDLRQGATDDETNGYVTYLQQLLGSYYTGQIDGYFGPITDAAVRQYQEDNGLTVDGWVGPITWGVLTGESAGGGGAGDGGGGGAGGGDGDQAVEVDWSQLQYLSSLLNNQPQDEESTRVALGVEPESEDDTAIA